MGRRNTVKRKPIARSTSGGFGVLPKNFVPVLDEIDRQAMNEGSAMRRIPSWRKKPNSIE